jgi:hypothetical protein
MYVRAVPTTIQGVVLVKCVLCHEYHAHVISKLQYQRGTKLLLAPCTKPENLNRNTQIYECTF